MNGGGDWVTKNTRAHTCMCPRGALEHTVQNLQRIEKKKERE